MEEIIKKSKSYRDACIKAYGYSNGLKIESMRKYIIDNDINIDHFKVLRKSQNYPVITKICPVCENKFETRKGRKDEKTTCSYSCSNTYFRTGKDHPNWKDISDSPRRRYRDICFKYHKKECIICCENKIVDVHHMDENHKNESPDNLIPLCPTHHLYWHSGYRYLIEEKVNNYIKKFKKS